VGVRDGTAAGNTTPPLHEHGVAPDSVEAADPLPHADDAKATTAVQRETGLVLREDARLDRPDPGRLGPRDQLLEQLPPDPAPLHGGRDIHTVLGDALVDAAGRDRRERGPADHAAVLLGDEPRAGKVRSVPLLPGRRLRLEGRVARGDPGLVDGSHGGPVVRPQLPDSWPVRPRPLASGGCNAARCGVLSRPSATNTGAPCVLTSPAFRTPETQRRNQTGH